MIVETISVFTLATLLMTIAFIIAGSSILSNLGPMRKLSEAKKAIQNMVVTKRAILQKNLLIFGVEPLHNAVNTAGISPAQEEYLHLSIYNALNIVHSRYKLIDDFIREIKVYSFIFYVVLMLSVLKTAFTLEFEGGMWGIWTQSVGNPLGLLAGVELAMIFFFGMRIWTEMKEVSDMLRH